MGGFSNFAISFSIISILTGAVILYDYGLAWAAPAAVMIGWPLVTVFVLLIAASMAEIASAYPTAGGLYYWASRMKNKNWGWWTAWLNLIGQFAIVAGINYAAAAFLNATIITPLLANVGIDYDNTTAILHRRSTILTGAARDDGHPDAHRAGHEHRRHQPRGDAQPGQRLVAHRHRRRRRRPGLPRRQAGRVRPDALRHPAPGRRRQLEQRPRRSSTCSTAPAITYPLVLAFFFSLLQANWTYTGYDASAHVAEETVGARVASAWGLFLSVAVSAIVGFIFLLALSTHLPDLSTLFPAVLDDADPAERQPVLLRWRRSRHRDPRVQPRLDDRRPAVRRASRSRWRSAGCRRSPRPAGCCSPSAATTALPGSGWLKKVSHRYRTPANSLTAMVVIAWLFSVAAVLRRRPARPSSSSPPSARSSCTPRTGSASTSARRPRSGSRSGSGASAAGPSRSPGWRSFWVIVLMVLFSWPDIGQHQLAVHGHHRPVPARLLLRLRSAELQGSARDGRQRPS